MSDNDFMQRCFELAQLGRSTVSPNPTVGAVLVHRGRIIGEGYHQRYGGPHAEVRAVDSVPPSDRGLLPESTLYVSLEPCCIFGRTPPCTDLILRERIPKVVVAQRDLTPGVSGGGLDRLRAAGVEVQEILPEKGLDVSLARQLYAAFQRPYIFLKYAQSADGFMAPDRSKDYWISHPISRRLVHRWRTQTAAILIGGGTLRKDNPQLTARYFAGAQPLAVVVSRSLDIPKSSQLFQTERPVVVAGPERLQVPPNTEHWVVDFSSNWIATILGHLHKQGVNHLTIEGGQFILQSFIEAGLWDEAAVFTNKHLYFYSGLKAPVITTPIQQQLPIASDLLAIYRNPATKELFSQSLRVH